jgi:hypothetical protein
VKIDLGVESVDSPFGALRASIINWENQKKCCWVAADILHAGQGDSSSRKNAESGGFLFLDF